MSVEHHGAFPAGHPDAPLPSNVQQANMQRLMDQIAGTAKREYPAGRMGADDDGKLAYAMTTDQAHQTIVIRFGKPVEWVGLGLEDARQLRDQLTERIMALTGTALGEPLSSHPEMAAQIERVTRELQQDAAAQPPAAEPDVFWADRGRLK